MSTTIAEFLIGLTDPTRQDLFKSEPITLMDRSGMSQRDQQFILSRRMNAVARRSRDSSSPIFPNWNNSKPLDSAQLGGGFTSFLADTRFLALKVPEIARNTVPATVDGYCKQVKSYESLCNMLDLSVDVNAHYGPFGGHDHFSLLEESDYTETSLLVLARVTARLPSTHWLGGDLARPEDAQHLTPLEFYRKYGDCWISRIDWGGDLFVILRVECKSIGEKTSVSNDLEAHAPLGSVDVQIKEYHQHLSSVGTVEIIFHKTGGTTSGVDLGTALNSIVNYGNEVASTGGRIVDIGLSGFDQTNWPPGGFTLTQFDGPRGWVLSLMQFMFDCRRYVAAGKFAQDHVDLFVPFDGKILQQDIDLAIQYLNAATQSALSIADDPIGAKQPAIPQISSLLLPISKAPEPPAVTTTAGILGISVVNATSGQWAGSVDGHVLDSYWISIPDPHGLDIHIAYQAKVWGWSNGPMGPMTTTVYSGIDGSRPPYSGIGMLIGAAIGLVAGSDSGLFDVYYQFHLCDGSVTNIAKNNEWLNCDTGNPRHLADGIRVWLQPKGSSDRLRFMEVSLTSRKP